ncbi:MarP family serine protease [Sciscionella marina]|uniref:MarP family serine protease n=1 Tax=Sciscionella marina TaxID=508770 RepID=UPI00036F8F99|nr:MarP family serine protease [Sciscionella marina]
MNWVDVLVILLAISVALIGAKQGLVVTLPAIVLMLAGAVVGIKLAPSLVSGIESLGLRAALSVGIPVLLAAVGETIGVYLGRLLKKRVTNRHVAGVDNALGAVLQAAVVLVVAWFVLLSLTGMPGMPGLVSAINSSKVLAGVNTLMPQAAKDLPSELRRQLNFPGFPTVESPFTQTPVGGEVGPPNTALQRSAVVRKVRPSVVKVRGRAPSCSRALEGSGFVVSPGKIMTNAHVVAGTTSTTVESANGTYTARVVYYDPEVDVAILSAPSLHARPLEFSSQEASTGQDAIVLGYPLDGPYTAVAAKVREDQALRIPDIYESQRVTRQVYILRATVRSGNSGGPLITPGGSVLGVVFGAGVNDSETGYALTRRQVTAALENVDSTSRVATGACAA